MIRLIYMSETILGPRQSYVLNTISQSNGLLRGEIQERVGKLYPVSKPTLIRDLNCLLKAGLIKASGQAKATRYLSASNNPLFRQFYLDQYFAIDPDKRVNVKQSFDFGIFDHLRHLFFPDELDDLQRSSYSFKEKISRLDQDILRRELERFVIELSWKSSKIEGNTYTLLETESLIKEQKEAIGKSKDDTRM